MGTPTQQSWPEGVKLAAAMNFRFPTFTTTPLSKIVTNASPEAIDLITSMCSWDPNKRPSAVQESCVSACTGAGSGLYSEPVLTLTESGSLAQAQVVAWTTGSGAMASADARLSLNNRVQCFVSLCFGDSRSNCHQRAIYGCPIEPIDA
eukprot:1161834-Pelagomonas_calceolata.AAC.4